MSAPVTSWMAKSPPRSQLLNNSRAAVDPCVRTKLRKPPDLKRAENIDSVFNVSKCTLNRKWNDI